MDAFLTGSGIDYTRLCEIISAANCEGYDMYITGESALYVYLTMAGKSLDWTPESITIKYYVSKTIHNKLLLLFINSGYNMEFSFKMGGYIFAKENNLPIILIPSADNKNRLDKNKLSILNLQWKPDTRFINGDLSLLVDAINMRAICYDDADDRSIAICKERGFKIYREL